MKQDSAALKNPPREAPPPGAAQPANDAAHAASGTSEERLHRALAFITAALAVWPDLVRLTDAQRNVTTGRLAPRYDSALRALFSVAENPRFAPAFSLLEMSDGIGASEPFNPARARAHLDRAAAMRRTATQMREAADALDDDALHHASIGVNSGLAALKVARSLAENNSTFRSAVAHVLNEFAAMTSAARRAQGDEGETPADPSDPAKPSPA